MKKINYKDLSASQRTLLSQIKKQEIFTYSVHNKRFHENRMKVIDELNEMGISAFTEYISEIHYIVGIFLLGDNDTGYVNYFKERFQ